MIQFILDFFGLNFSKPIPFSFQIFSYLSILWFSIKSGKVIRRELKKEHFQQGVLPILAFVYMGFSIFYTYEFIKNFDEISSLNERVLRDYFADFQFLNLNENVFKINLLTCLILSAFTFNFSKSFFSLNSLEFGYFNEVALKELFEQNKIKVILEGCVRLFIAYKFVTLEHLFSQENIISNQDPKKYLGEIGQTGLWLYGSLVLWAIIITYLSISKSKRLFTWAWYVLTFIQFIFGVLLTYYFIFFSKNEMPSGEYLQTFYLTLWLGFIISTGIILSIIINECLNPKYTKKNGNTSNGLIPKSA